MKAPSDVTPEEQLGAAADALLADLQYAHARLSVGGITLTNMNRPVLSVALTTLFGELVDGPSPEAAFVLNKGDVGLLRSLDKLSAQEASASSGGGASIAAHVDHLRYGLSLMNRWSAGEQPFDTADWSVSWQRTIVSDAEWQTLRTHLDGEARQWLDALHLRRDYSAVDTSAIIGSIAHLAYHLGAIRQISRAARGPAEAGRLE